MRFFLTQCLNTNTIASGATHYLIDVNNPDGVNRGIRQILLDGNPLPNNLIPLADDGKQHEVIVSMDSVISPHA